MRKRALAKNHDGVAIDGGVVNTDPCCRRSCGNSQVAESLSVTNSNFRQRRTSMNSQDDLRSRHPIDRRTFVSMVAAGAAGTLVQGAAAAAQPAPKTRN